MGSDFLGFLVSAAANPANSVPANENAAVTKTLQTPLNPLANAPGEFQSFPPIYPSLGPPPQTNTIPNMINPMIANTLQIEKQNSASPYPLTPKKFIQTIKT